MTLTGVAAKSELGISAISERSWSVSALHPSPDHILTFIQAACNKTESVIAELPGVSLDDLIARKKINADQKAQILKKPALQSELVRLEEQLVHYRKFGKDYEDRFAKEKIALEESHGEALTKAKLEALDEATLSSQKKVEDDLLILSQFLHAAAAKRTDGDLDAVEKAAFEGVLLLVYQGNSAAIAAFKDIAAGAEKKVISTSGDELDFTYNQIKKISVNNAPVSGGIDAGVETPEAADVTTETGTDPTIANAGLTELEDTLPKQPSAESTEQQELEVPAQSSTASDAANAVAERSWDPQDSMVSETPSGEGWVQVTRDPAETDTGVSATPAALHNSSSWAEEVNADAAAEEKVAPENDGFEQVVHHPARGRGRVYRGDFRGRGRGGEYRGRGRGDRDRGDGERRGGRGGRGRGGDGNHRGDGGNWGGNRGARGPSAQSSGW